jgi:hypothetical protein
VYPSTVVIAVTSHEKSMGAVVVVVVLEVEVSGEVVVAVDGGGSVVTGAGAVVEVTTSAGSFTVHAAVSNPKRTSVAMTLTIGERIRLGEPGPCSCVDPIRTGGQDLRKNGRCSANRGSAP